MSVEDAPVAQRADELLQRVLAPLVLGGRLTPVRPFGPSLALRIGQRGPVIDIDLRSRLDVARVRQARRIAPVDTLPELGAAELTLAAGLNDLLQSTNHELAGAFTRGRHGRLLASVAELCEHVPAPRDVEEALARHATFARVLELSRTDTTVSWWTGRASFRGQAPPSRLLTWRKLRRVQVNEQRVALVDMCHGLAAVQDGSFCDTLGLWLTRSPLTDIATATRSSPRFGWSSSTLALISTRAGRTLAWRLLARQTSGAVLTALERAAREVPAGYTAAKALAEGFAAEVAEALQTLEEKRA